MIIRKMRKKHAKKKNVTGEVEREGKRLTKEKEKQRE